MAEPRVVFGQTFDALYLRGLAGRRTPALDAKLREAGLDLSKPLLPAYPVEDWVRWFKLTAAELHPGLAEEAAHRQLGQRMILGLTETLLGKAMFGTLSLIGPMRTLGRLGRNFRNGNNYTETTMTQLGPTEAEIGLNQVDGIPGFFAGVVEAAGGIIGAREIVVDIRPAPDGGCTLRVQWKGK